MSDGVKIVHNGKLVNAENPLPIKVTGNIGLLDSVTFTDGKVLPDIWNITKEPTGFVEGCIVTGNGTDRKVTLSGTVEAYWKGARITVLTPGWVSPAHETDTAKVYYLYSSNGTAPTWSETLWSFSYLQVASAFYDATLGWVYARECHGFMPHDCHENDHYNVGSWRQSGGDLDAIITGSTTAANRRPTVSQMTHHDEDLETTQAAITNSRYTHAFLANVAVSTFTETNLDIVPLSTNNPYYNSYSAPNWGQTLMPANSVMSIWLVSIPMAADANSQELRFVWGQGQWITQAQGPAAGQLTTALNSELLRNFSEMNLGNLAALSPEFLPIARIIITYTGGNWYVSSVSNLTGGRYKITQAPAGGYLSSVGVTAPIAGEGTAASPILLQNDATTTLTSFSTDGTLAGNTDTDIPTEKAVKTYADTKLTATRGNWKTFHSNGTGVFTELALGASGTILCGEGAAAAPTMQVPQPRHLSQLAYGLLESDFWNATANSNFPRAGIGSGSITTSSDDSDHPGIAVINTSTANNTGFYWSPNVQITSLDGCVFYCIFQVIYTTSFAGLFGFHDATSATINPTSCAAIRISGSTLDGFSQVGGSGGASTGTSYALSASTWYIGKVIYTSSARVDYYLYLGSDGSLLWTDFTTADIPSGVNNMEPRISTYTPVAPAGNTASCKLDYVAFYRTAISDRYMPATL